MTWLCRLLPALVLLVWAVYVQGFGRTDVSVSVWLVVEAAAFGLYGWRRG